MKRGKFRPAKNGKSNLFGRPAIMRFGTGPSQRDSFPLSRQQVVRNALFAGSHVVDDSARFKTVAYDYGALYLAVQFKASAARQKLTAIDSGRGSVGNPYQRVVGPGTAIRRGSIKHAGINHHVFCLIDHDCFLTVRVPLTAYNRDLCVCAVDGCSPKFAVPIASGDFDLMIANYVEAGGAGIRAAVDQVSGEGTAAGSGVGINLYARCALVGQEAVKTAPGDAPKIKSRAGGKSRIAPNFDVLKLDEIAAFADLHAYMCRLHDENIRKPGTVRCSGGGRGDAIVRRLDAEAAKSYAFALKADGRGICGGGNTGIVFYGNAVDASTILQDEGGRAELVDQQCRQRHRIRRPATGKFPDQFHLIQCQC
jgi:hypothetical protein